MLWPVRLLNDTGHDRLRNVSHAWLQQGNQDDGAMQRSPLLSRLRRVPSSRRKTFNRGRS